jgi:hypothetical protein
MSLVFNSLSESSQNSTSFVFFDCCSRSSTTRNMEIHDVSWVTFQDGITDLSYL